MACAKPGDTWGTILPTPPACYVAMDATALTVSKAKEAIDLAIAE
jgi:hypothetical protein